MFKVTPLGCCADRVSVAKTESVVNKKYSTVIDRRNRKARTRRAEVSVSAHHQDTKIVRGGRTRTDDLLLQRDAQPTELLPLRVNDEQDLNLHTRDAPAALMLAYRPRIRCKQHSDTACVKRSS